jgi:hypothetical protein
MNRILFLISGLLLCWLAITGKLGVFLASIFVPSTVKLKNNEDIDDEDTITSGVPLIEPLIAIPNNELSNSLDKYKNNTLISIPKENNNFSNSLDKYVNK